MSDTKDFVVTNKGNGRGKSGKYVNSNIPLPAEDHLKLRMIALKQRRT